MNRLNELSNTYIPAPWRKQSRLTGLFLLALVMIALVSSVYLSISSRTASVGREIQSMQHDIELLDREIEDLRYQIAYVKSSEEMEKRAMAQGFNLVEADQVVYLSIPDYAGRAPTELAPYSQRAVVSAPVLPAVYTESLYEWLLRQMNIFSIVWVQQ